MVLMVEPIMKAIKTVQNYVRGRKSRIIVFSAKGKKFDQATARRWAKYDQLVLICGRYEGIDERVGKYLADEEISIGDYVLFGGEVPAMVVIEAVTRLLPGAVGKQESIRDESFKTLTGVEKEMMEKFIEYPHYTRPEKIKINGRNKSVPKILLTGHHANIERWRQQEAFKLSKKCTKSNLLV